MPRSRSLTKTIRNCRGGSRHAFLPPYFQTPQPIAETRHRSADECRAIHLRARYSRTFRARCSRQTRARDRSSMSMRPPWCRPGSGPTTRSRSSIRRSQNFLSRAEGSPPPPVNLVVRIAFNPNVETAWFTSVMGIINSITMLAIVLAGAAVVREREHGTMDHLLVMPLTPFEIAMSKIWANGLVIVVAVGLSLYFIVRGHARHTDCWFNSTLSVRGCDLSCSSRPRSASSLALSPARCRS